MGEGSTIKPQWEETHVNLMPFTAQIKLKRSAQHQAKARYNYFNGGDNWGLAPRALARVSQRISISLQYTISTFNPSTNGCSTLRR